MSIVSVVMVTVATATTEWARQEEENIEIIHY